MSTLPLRARLVKLAYANPELRPHVLPLLQASEKSARYQDWKETIVGETVRIRWSDHPDNAIKIEELPTKPVKRQLRVMEGQTLDLVRWMGSAFLMTNLIRDMKPRSSMSYEQAVDAFRAALNTALDITKAEKPEFTDKMAEQYGFKWAVREGTVFFLEVEPHDYEAMVVKGKDFTLSSEWGTFKAYSPGSFSKDDPNTYGAHYSGVVSSAPAGARKLFKVLKADPDALRNVPYHLLSDWFRSAKIPFDSIHSSWR